jgi:Muconolactone delta-isomerase
MLALGRSVEISAHSVTPFPQAGSTGGIAMKCLAVSHNTGDPTAHIADEMRRIDELKDAGVIEQLYLKADRSGAVIVLETDSATEAEQQLATLPLVERGVTRFEVTELAPMPGAG